ncbi:hypothetical protein P170DRAFT_454418 [Aspergillus steynii IBT 23096]|uniref:Actin-like ATPase domain-containing protein n=1 Tax=Aspergillus steynii IBT 23096 TaxID=1392250 RepID=A0A2I2GK94_9EURO|nr:uncharacterized protein P170DRAFT_454418 [Aspergillus steynii IBT 23096]PLB53308.1 hypothetical protein P170DRAFT_454418 [Aspergillus steynii IBT 23096]
MEGFPEYWTPDIVVGIDFGMTYTGVAYSSAPEWLPPKTIQRWPGKLPNELANKVPTFIEYSKSGNVENWGFQCDPEAKESDIKEFFKLHLAPQYQDEHYGGPTRGEAQRWFQDYVDCIYKHIVSHFSNTMPHFGPQNVEFLFSVPTTWKDVRMVQETREILERIINTKNPRHRAVIGLTEAEAAAVYAGNEHYLADDTILVCDAGGGTTDVNVLKLISNRGEPTRLEQLGHVEGQPIGSVFIDRRIHHLIYKRLEKVRDHLEMSPSDAAWMMISGRFQRMKCAFGTKAILTPWLTLDVPTIESVLDFPEAEIYRGQMRIAWEHVQECFDLMANKMCTLLDGHISQMHSKYPGDQITHLVLSGGFGSSPYIKQCLVEKFGSLAVNKHPNAEDMHILLADEPQLVVVHGLVLDRIQQIKRGVVTFGSRCPPVSYGIVCDKLYDPKKHVGQPVRLDPRDNNTFAVDQIDWLVIQARIYHFPTGLVLRAYSRPGLIVFLVQGTPIPSTGMTKEFQLKADLGRENEPWTAQIVMSTRDPANLQRNMSENGVQRVCNINVSTIEVDKKLKNRHWYSVKPHFWRIAFEVKVIVGPADLSFELWSKDKKVRSDKHEPIAVSWMPAQGSEE